jgi:hypothetical protein
MTGLSRDHRYLDRLLLRGHRVHAGHPPGCGGVVRQNIDANESALEVCGESGRVAIGTGGLEILDE